MPGLIDLTGQRFGRLVVAERVGNRGCKVAWKCRCECGHETIATSSDLKQGNVKSCGCLGQGKGNERHGHSKEFIYRTYGNMKTRCFNSKNKRFTDYGGRGITVCEQWKNDFQAFYDYVSQLPHFGEEGYTLDRINNDGNYEPGNVRWATKKEQRTNQRKRSKKNG